MEGRAPTKEEIFLGGAIGGGFPLAADAASLGIKAIKNAIPGLEVSGLLTPAKLDQVSRRLIDEDSGITGKLDAKDVGTRMVDRGFKGGAGEIIEQLTTYGKQSKELVDDLLAKSTTTHKSPAARKALENMLPEVEKTPGLE